MRILLALALCAASAACEGDGAGLTAGVGEACGARAGATCAAGLFCDFGNNRCGADDAGGQCAPRPDACPLLLVPEPTCACDGRVYSSACDAQLAGADVDAGGACALPAASFACGYRQCRRQVDYCRRDVSDVVGEPDGFACQGLPAGCGGAPSCACLAGQPCGDACAGSATGGLTLTCPGG